MRAYAHTGGPRLIASSVGLLWSVESTQNSDSGKNRPLPLDFYNGGGTEADVQAICVRSDFEAWQKQPPAELRSYVFCDGDRARH